MNARFTKHKKDKIGSRVLQKEEDLYFTIERERQESRAPMYTQHAALILLSHAKPPSVWFSKPFIFPPATSFLRTRFPACRSKDGSFDSKVDEYDDLLTGVNQGCGNVTGSDLVTLVKSAARRIQ